jgi:class 3 adenylate cyclase
MADSKNLPTGVVTFLFTDVVDSTRQWEADRETMVASLRLHDEVVRAAVEFRNGNVFSTAVAAVETQTELKAAVWPGSPLWVPRTRPRSSVVRCS